VYRENYEKLTGQHFNIIGLFRASLCGAGVIDRTKTVCVMSDERLCCTRLVHWSLELFYYSVYHRGTPWYLSGNIFPFLSFILTKPVDLLKIYQIHCSAYIPETVHGLTTVKFDSFFEFENHSSTRGHIYKWKKNCFNRDLHHHFLL